MTELVYWEDTYLGSLDGATVESIEEHEGKEGMEYCTVLDKTIFHPQGGGQPSDSGVITANGVEFNVSMVRKDGETVKHYGNFTNGGPDQLPKGSKVALQINLDDRRLYARIHSAGHLLDAAVQNLGLQLEPGKGYHFPNSPFVEYKGTIPPSDRNDIKTKLNDG